MHFPMVADWHSDFGDKNRNKSNNKKGASASGEAIAEGMCRVRLALAAHRLSRARRESVIDDV
jgi:hypothetical protein